ncbi:hypothetical protein [Ferrimicrobium sp.]|nr:hypothetical protein [Ferrimicrobium sp.]
MQQSSSEGSPDYKELLELVSRELRKAQAQLAHAKLRVEALEVTYRELSRLLGLEDSHTRSEDSKVGVPAYEPESDTGVQSDREVPSVSRAVLTVMRTRPSHAWNANEIAEQLVARGWMPDGVKPMATLRACLFRLYHRSGQITNVDRGRFRLVPDKPSPEQTQLLGTDHGGDAYPLAM